MRRDRYTDGKTRKGCGENPCGKVSLFIKKKKKGIVPGRAPKQPYRAPKPRPRSTENKRGFQVGFVYIQALPNTRLLRIQL